MSGCNENTPNSQTGKGKQLTFPMLQAGADPFCTVLSYYSLMKSNFTDRYKISLKQPNMTSGQLATFLDIAGRKLDKAEDAKEHHIQDFQLVLFNIVWVLIHVVSNMYP